MSTFKITEQLWDDTINIAKAADMAYVLRTVLQAKGSQETTDGEFETLCELDEKAFNLLTDCSEKHDIAKDSLIDFVRMLIGIKQISSWDSWLNANELKDKAIGQEFIPISRFMYFAQE